MRSLSVLLLVVLAVGALVYALFKTPGMDKKGPTITGPGETEEVSTKGPETLSNPDTVTDDGPRTKVPQVEPAVSATKVPSNNVLTGLVVGPKGNGIATAKVTLTRFGTNSLTFLNDPGMGKRSDDIAVETDGEGRYAFRGIQPFGQYAIVANHPDYAPTEVGEVSVPDSTGTFEEPPIMLGPGGLLVGRVDDIGGVPVEGAELRLDPGYALMSAEGWVPPDRLVATSDASGAFRFENVSAGNKVLSCVKEGFGTEVRSNLNFGQQGKKEIMISMSPASMLAGQVRSTAAAPIEGATVLAIAHAKADRQARQTTLSDAEGRFMLPDLPPGTYTLSVTAEGFKTGRANQVQTGETQLVVELQALPKIRGRVVSADGKPVKAFDLVLRQHFEHAPQTSPTNVRGSFQHPDGEFELVGAVPGDYVLEARADAYSPSFSDPFTIQAGQDLAGVLVRAKKGGSIVGQLIDSEGKGISGATVKTRDNQYTDDAFTRALGDSYPTNCTSSSTRTGPGGRFELRLLNPETYMIEITSPSHADYNQRDILVADSTPTDLGTIQMQSGGKVEGLLLDEAGQPVVGGIVRMATEPQQGVPMREYRVKANQDGRYSIGHVIPGTYQISGRRPPTSGNDPLAGFKDLKATQQRIIVQEGLDVSMDIRLGG